MREHEPTGRLPLARDLMATKLLTVGPEDDVFGGAGILLRHGISGAPVIAPDHTFLGTLSERSCMRLLTLTAEATAGERPALPARKFMTTKLVTLRPETDALEAVALLLEHRFSGAPVVDGDGRFLGVFSERYIMRLLVRAAYEQVPSPEVGAYMNTDRGRLIVEESDLLAVAQTFLDTYYRRLPVLRGETLVGQVSHRDVLRAEHHLARRFDARETAREALRDEARTPEAKAAVAAGLATTRVADFMTSGVETVDEDTDFLALAQIFLDSNRRRLPVLRDGRLVGQVSRRDLLAAALDLIALEPEHERGGLYLSAVLDRNVRPLLNRADYNRRGAGHAARISERGDRDRKT